MKRQASQFVFFLLLTLGVLPLAVRAADARPNVLVIVGDDMGYADIGIHGCQDIPTPNIDKLAAEGTRCTNGYVSGPYCSPTRAGLLTGRYQTRFGHEFNPGGEEPKPAQPAGKKKNAKAQDNATAKADQELGLPLTETTIADRLKAAGYSTAWIGKWHLGAELPYIPQNRGFETSFGFLGGAHGYFPNAKPPLRRQNETIQEQEYLTDAFRREAVDFIEHQSSDKPFFMYLAFNAVHTPMNATDDRLEKLKGIKDEKRRTYAAMMLAMDEAIGKVLRALREKHLEDNTLVFFIADNGGPTMPGTTTNASNNAPFRGSKRTTLEGGIHVPFLVKWPGHVPAAKLYDNPVIQLDILPTVLAAAGVEAPADAKLDGVDLLPYLTDKNKEKPHSALYWRFGDQMAIRQGDWKLVRYDPVVDGMKGTATDAKLYNLATDVGESNDLIKSEPEKAKALQAAWDEWNKSNVPPLWGAQHLMKKGKGKRSQASLERAAKRIATAE